MRKPLSLIELKACARDFVIDMSGRDLPDLFGITDGKAVGLMWNMRSMTI